MRLHSLRGFTLVELLVVIAIIGVLVALLLPAVQAAREAVRRIECSNNMKQIGLAIHLYHNTHNTLPPGAIWDGSEELDRGSILVCLLPFIEQQAIHDALDFKKSIHAQKLPDGRKLGQVKIKLYVCPTDGETNWSGVQAASYSASAGSSKVHNILACPCSKGMSWNSFGQAEVNHSSGPFTRQPSLMHTDFAGIRDGLSNTIFFGEVRSKCSDFSRAGWFHSNNGNGLVTTVVPINSDSCDEANPDGCKRPCNWSFTLGFKSQHSDGAQFLLGDGSVRFFNQAIDHWTYQWLGTRNDGKVFKMP